MKNYKVARRYAKALYELGLTTNTMGDVLLGMSNLSLALKTTPEMGRAFTNPLIAIDDKVKLARVVTSNKLVLRFIALLAKRKRLSLTMLVNDELVALNDLRVGNYRPLIRTAEPLTQEERAQVEAKLARSFGGTIMGRFEVAKDLIGGVWIKIGDKVLDTSLKGRIDDFRHALLHSTN